MGPDRALGKILLRLVFVDLGEVFCIIFFGRKHLRIMRCCFLIASRWIARRPDLQRLPVVGEELCWLFKFGSTLLDAIKFETRRQASAVQLTKRTPTTFRFPQPPDPGGDTDVLAGHEQL